MRLNNYQNSNEPSKIEYWISWGHLPEYQGQSLTETLARTYHYTLESIDVNQLFKPDKGRSDLQYQAIDATARRTDRPVVRR